MKKVYLILMVGLGLIITGQTFAQTWTLQCPTSTPGIIQQPTTAVLDYNEVTPPIVYSQAPSGLPNTEFLITSYAAKDDNGNPTIIGVDDDGVFLPRDFGLELGDTFCITPFSYDLKQFQDFIDLFLTDDAATILFTNISCCDVVELGSGFLLGQTLNLCDSINSYGIFKGTDLMSFDQAYDILFQVLGNNGIGVVPGDATISTGQLDTLLDFANDTIDQISLSALANGIIPGLTIIDDSVCGLEVFPICYDLEPDSAVCYEIGCVFNPGQVFNASFCAGGSVTFGNLTFNTAGTFFDTLTSSYGCDSINTFNISSSAVILIQDDRTICQGEVVNVGSNSYTTAGMYLDTFTSSIGCDSIVQTNLTVNDTFRVQLSATICEGDDYMGYTTTGIHIDTLTTVNNCDSLIEIDLTVTPLGRDTIHTGFCFLDSVTINGTVYNAAGTYNQVIATGGCDSVLTIVVEVYTPPAKPTISQLNNELSIPDIWARYQWLFNGQFLAGDTTSMLTITVDGYYQIGIGDSNGCLNVSDSLFAQVTGIEYIGIPANSIRMYPNPTSAKLNIEVVDDAMWQDATIAVFSYTGQLVRQTTVVNNQNAVIDMSDLSSGIYLVEISNAKGKATARIVKH